MVAALLLPLLTTTTLVLTPRANWALGQLASNSVAVLVQRLGLDYLKSRMQLDQSALNQAHMRLTHAHTYAQSLLRRRTTDDLATLLLTQCTVERQPTCGPPRRRSTMRCASGWSHAMRCWPWASKPAIRWPIARASWP